MSIIDSHTPATVGQVILAASVVAHGAAQLFGELRAQRVFKSHVKTRQGEETGRDQSPGPGPASPVS